jgi:hypothetical protein
VPSGATEFLLVCRQFGNQSPAYLTGREPAMRISPSRLALGCQSRLDDLKVPVISISSEEARTHFGFFGIFAGRDLSASSAQTQERLGWHPSGPGLIADLEKMRYFEA